MAEYKAANKDVKRSARKDKRMWVNALTDQAQTVSDNQDSRTLYAKTRKLSPKNPTLNNTIKDENGVPHSTIEEQMKCWENHLKKSLISKSRL